MLIRSYSERCQKSEMNKSKLLSFLYDETWSSAPVLSKVLALSNSATYKIISKNKKSGLIKRHHIPELGLAIWGITKEGIIEAWDYGMPVENKATFEPSKINALFVLHHLDLQIARLNAEAENWQDWKADKLLPKGLRKRPDAVVQTTSGQTIAIEYERTIKTLKRYEVIWAIFLMDIKAGLYDQIHYIVPDDKTHRSLTRIFSLIQNVPVNGQRIKIEDKHRRRFKVHLLKKWPRLQDS